MRNLNISAYPVKAPLSNCRRKPAHQLLSDWTYWSRCVNSQFCSVILRLYMDSASGRAIRALDLELRPVFIGTLTTICICTTVVPSSYPRPRLSQPTGSLPTSWESSSCNVSIIDDLFQTLALPHQPLRYIKLLPRVNKRNMRERSLLLLSAYHYRIPAPGAGKTSPHVMIGFWSSFSLVDQKTLRGFLAIRKAHQCKTNATAI